MNALRVSQHPCLYLSPLVRKTRAAGAIYFCIGEISNQPPNLLPRSGSIPASVFFTKTRRLATAWRATSWNQSGHRWTPFCSTGLLASPCGGQRGAQASKPWSPGSLIKQSASRRAEGIFFGPLALIRGNQCRCLGLIVPQLSYRAIRPTLHLRRNPNDLCKHLPMPWVWLLSTSANLCRVRF